MITYTHNEEKQLGNETYIWFIGDCLSTDFKPVDKVYDGSKLFEKDTLKQFVYSYPKKQWEETVAGGGSSSCTCNTLVVNVITDEENPTITLDKTFAEIIDADFVVIKSNYSDGSEFEQCFYFYYGGFIMDNMNGEYAVLVNAIENAIENAKTMQYTFFASSMDDYPVLGSTNTSDPGTSDPGTSDPGTSDPGTLDPLVV